MYWTRACLAQEGRDRRGDELLAVAAADDQRALLAGPDQQAGLVGAHRHERVVAAEVGVGRADGVDQVAVVVVGDQVGDHLGVGLGGEHGAVVDQLLLERDVVLDDAVDDDVDAVGGVEVRVGVLLGDPAVGRPARVADPGSGVRALGDRDAAPGISLARRGQLGIDRGAAARSGCRPRGRRRSGPVSTEMPALS